MATTTPNFGWSVPTSTDYVKDGALAIETLGDAIDASLVDLKGGASGYILSKNSATDMDFAWIPNALPATPAGINKILNGDFGIWQRGTSVTASASTTTFTSDRWALQTNANQAHTVSRQTVSDSTNLPNIKYCSRVQRNSGQTGTAFCVYAQSIETVQSVPLAGQQITLSFYARSGADFSPTSDTLTAYLFSGTGTDQSIVSGSYTGQATVVTGNANLTSTWTRYSFTGTVPSTSNELAIYLTWQPSGTAGTNDYFEITGVQLEAGSVATPFATATGNPASELAACQRYYIRWSDTGSGYRLYGQGPGASTTQAYPSMSNTVSMRVAPTSVEYSALRLFDGVNGFAVTNLALQEASPNFTALLATVASGLTAKQQYLIGSNNNSAGYIALSAEL